MIRAKLIFVGLGLVFMPWQLLGHGEDQPGPNGGAIRMPGAFHTEVLQKSDQKIWVYLLDVNFEDPRVTDSMVHAKLKQGQNMSDLNCTAKRLYFECTTVKNQRLNKKGTLVITASRNQVTGGAATYPLPFKGNK